MYQQFDTPTIPTSKNCMLLKSCHYFSGNYTQEASLTRQRYSERTGQAAAAARAALSLASRDLYRCDPPVHEEGRTDC